MTVYNVIMAVAVTREEFEQQYAAGGGMTVEQLHALGLCAVSCRPDCDYDGCQGWIMALAPAPKKRVEVD